MRVVAAIVFVCLTAGCLALKPRPCRSPPLLTGSLSVASSDDKLSAFAKFSYDALRQRVRLTEFGSYSKKPFQFDVLLLYREHVMYVIDYKNHTCTKKPLNVDFHPLAIPNNASLLGKVVLGSSPGLGQGLKVSSWGGEVQTKNETVRYMTTVTVFGCVPVTTLFHTKATGYVVISFFNNFRGIPDPRTLVPPPFCKDAQLEEDDKEDLANFFSLF